jgi:hypothetical protein
MDESEMLVIAILMLVFIGLPIGIGLLFYFIPKKLGYPKVAKYLTKAYVLVLLTIVSINYFKEWTQERKKASAILLADREAPLGWVYLRIFSDSSFELENSGFLSSDIYAGKAKITADSIFFYYKDSIPGAGNKAVYSDTYVAYINGTHRERVEISSSKLKRK